MKITRLLILLFSFWLFACASNRKDAPADWKALDAYHEILAQVYHPLKDSGNLEPAKRLFNELATKGDSLKTSVLPEKVDNENMKLLISKITDDTRALANEIKSGAADSVISAKLTPIHDQFHKILQVWKSEAEHEQEDHD